MGYLEPRRTGKLTAPLDSDPQVRKRFAKSLQFISLNLVSDYSTPPILELLGKDEYESLQEFRRDYTDLLRSVQAYPQQIAELHVISVFRCLLVFSGGRDDLRQRKLDPTISANTNANLYSSLVGISGSDSFGSVNMQAMLDVLSQSKVFADDDICSLNITRLTSQMDLPTDVLCDFGKALVDKIHGDASIPLNYL
ncbi:hypothetical protein LHYA1_G002368 [Lachnellula hyalina]|uniref:Uncharacterized protein n=1 Tax=Lachnellula hyalina TaxID=1316788 RepID=A0A8H8R579_9HELO|nr:uncharacterized protein LHYA1_G002368 [Lachnellula hyalina]TVY28649.1 hypothetical protein LHYA1_G002368 [Lachnellula hyalina]